MIETAGLVSAVHSLSWSTGTPGLNPFVDLSMGLLPPFARAYQRNPQSRGLGLVKGC